MRTAGAAPHTTIRPDPDLIAPTGAATVRTALGDASGGSGAGDEGAGASATETGSAVADPAVALPSPITATG